MKKIKIKIILIGGGGHGRVIIDAIKKAENFSICGIVDKNLPKGNLVSGIPVVGSDDILPGLFKKGVKHAFIGIGSVGDCDIRKRIYNNLKQIGFSLPVILHPRAVIAENVNFGEGTFIAAGAVISAGVKIGKNSIVNTNSSVDHDCVIGDFVHIAPGATLSGGVKAGDDTHIGIGANVLQDLTIGKSCIIGAGVTVRHDVSDGNKELGTQLACPNEKA